MVAKDPEDVGTTMAIQDIDAVVIVSKEKVKPKLFKEAVIGGSSLLSKDVMMTRMDNGPSTVEQCDKRAGTKIKKEKWMRNGCLAKTVENPRYEATSPLIDSYIQHMKYHALIEKFMGIWPSKKDLCFG
jgi:hypothetical protein